jgi:sugar fermentation stimulation protein A
MAMMYHNSRNNSMTLVIWHHVQDDRLQLFRYYVAMQSPYFPDTVKAVFLARPNRFIVLCRAGKRTLRAYLPNPGRLWELFFPGVIIRLVRHPADRGGSTEHTVVAVERDGRLIMLHTQVNNLVAKSLIEQGLVPGLAGAVVIRPEVTIGKSRFDFLLSREGREIVLEVKSCTLVGNRIAMFPDAVTVRGTRHLRELEQIVDAGGQAAVLFLIHWPKAEYFMPEWHTDLELATILASVRKKVQVMALSVEWSQDLTLGRARPVTIPWGLVEREAHDRGSYIVIVQLKRDRRLEVGGMGEIKFKKGYYCYVGSARANLSKRIERHRRLRKSLFWHIDYLRAEAEMRAAIPIRASEELECEIAAAMRKIAGWTVPGFGSSDCRCVSHLFGMDEDPVRTRSFIDLLMYFRIDRLEKYLE